MHAYACVRACSCVCVCVCVCVHAFVCLCACAERYGFLNPTLLQPWLFFFCLALAEQVGLMIAVQQQECQVVCLFTISCSQWSLFDCVQAFCLPGSWQFL